MNVKKLSLRHRINHIIFFEVFAIVLLTPIISSYMKNNLSHTFLMTITTSIIASVWNFLFNLFFDIFERKIGKDRSKRSLLLRVGHSFTFQISLMIFIIPTIMIFLGIGFYQAAAIDISILFFFIVYTGIYNYIFDVILFKLILKAY